MIFIFKYFYPSVLEIDSEKGIKLQFGAYSTMYMFIFSINNEEYKENKVLPRSIAILDEKE